MIGVRILGLLGNHLFQFAAIYATAKRLGVPFFVEYGTVRMNKPRLEKYFILRGYSYWFNAFRSWRWKSRLPLVHFTNEQSPSEVSSKIHDNVVVQFFFQSEEYFHDYKNEIQSLFTIKRKYVEAFEKKYATIFKSAKTIAIHWRRGDYLQEGFALPESYFRNCLAKIDDLSAHTVFFVSDDVAFMKQTFGDRSNYIFDMNDEITDFQILMNVDIAIISNSTFSWWAAYLNRKDHKIVMGPNYWLGFEQSKELPVGVMKTDWHWVNVY